MLTAISVEALVIDQYKIHSTWENVCVSYATNHGITNA